MVERTAFLVAPYSALAEVYDRAGFSAYAEHSIPRWIACAQAIDWAGRRVLDLGCGTGISTWWLAQQGYRVAGIDASAQMLAQAGQQGQRWEELLYDAPEFVQMDMRQLESPLGHVDLVVALGGVLNAVTSLRELEATFQRVNAALDPGRLFIFDLHTIRGLAASGGGEIAYDNGDDLSVTLRSRFSFETLSRTRLYTIWQRHGEGWQRRDELHTERGFPTQGVSMLLERSGFRVAAVLGPDLQPFDLQQDLYEQVIFLAEKSATGG